ncbi:DUF6193 family natural product biosynthesis protein [Streptomyces anandii]|uniref:DUF6193 family natural product biosynthesis protein n=1 Tax=Streptomyces anandii TaxID=285454 RepID=UPI0036BB6CAA
MPMLAAGGNSGDPGLPAGPVDAEHYPDLALRGGLVAALVHLARERGVDLGEVEPLSGHGAAAYRTAGVESDRGKIAVRLGLGRRGFDVSLDSSRGTFVWASGETDDLLRVVLLMDAWRRGAPLTEIGDRFPFMEYGRLSQGYEDGTPVQTQWDILLEDEELADYREFFRQVRAHRRLGAMFPFVSHWVLRLAVDPFERDAGGIFVDPRPDGSYLVWSSKDETRRAAGDFGQAAEVAEALVRGL